MIVPADRQLVHQVSVVIGLPIQPRPGHGRRRGAEPLTEGEVLGPTAGQHGHEPATPGGDVAEILAAGQLAVGHVEEVRAADQVVQQVPGSDVGAVVHHVATVAGEIDRHVAVAGDRQDIEQLLEIGTPGLAVSPGDGVGGPPPLLGFLGRIVVGAVERHGGGIVVQLLEAELELLNHPADDCQDQGRPDPLEHAVEAAAETVVVQSGQVLRLESEEVGRKAGGPLAHAIDGLA